MKENPIAALSFTSGEIMKCSHAIHYVVRVDNWATSFCCSVNKGKVTPLQARLCPRGGRGIALLFQDLGARRG